MSEFTTLYRQYRPSKFKDVIGEGHSVKVLEGTIKAGTISHAYLFSGGRGIGKTSVARIFASEIGTTDNDLHEMDAASNRGIDDIREIRDGVNVLPFESKYKVYIIDEVHMLTKEAFNALLKTLEEPPPHAIFILATTELDKVPETVVSRCQTFVFKKPNQKILKDHILDVAKKEGFSMTPSSAELIALLGDGSFRDALGVLQKVIGSTKAGKTKMPGAKSSHNQIIDEEVEIVTGAPRGTLVNDFVTALDQKNSAAGLVTLSTVRGQNIDMSVFLKLLLHKVRAVLLIRLSPDLKKEFEGEFSAEDFAFIEALATKKDSAISSKTILELLTAENRLRFSPLPELPLELALISLTG